jgi:hypothetical protein
MAVYARFDMYSLAGTSSRGDSAVSMHTRLVPASMLSRRLSVDDEPQDLEENILANFNTCDLEIPSSLIVLLNLLRMISARTTRLRSQ